jgi:prevent-host-death family protein
MESVGVRQLRARLAYYVDRAAAGETVEVTRGGRTVARLVGEPDDAALRDALASGRLTTVGGAFRRPSRRARLHGSGPGVDELVREGRR